jgi:hypothetical protein
MGDQTDCLGETEPCSLEGETNGVRAGEDRGWRGFVIIFSFLLVLGPALLSWAVVATSFPAFLDYNFL